MLPDRQGGDAQSISKDEYPIGGATAARWKIQEHGWPNQPRGRSRLGGIDCQHELHEFGNAVGAHLGHSFRTVRIDGLGTNT